MWKFKTQKGIDLMTQDDTVNNFDDFFMLINYFAKLLKKIKILILKSIELMIFDHICKKFEQIWLSFCWK